MEIHVNSCWLLEADGNDLECITTNSTVTSPVRFCLWPQRCRICEKGSTITNHSLGFLSVAAFSTLLWHDIKFLLPATVYVHTVFNRLLWIQSSSHRERLSVRQVEAVGNLWKKKKKFGAVFSCCFFVKFCSRFYPKKTKTQLGNLFSNLTCLMGFFTLLRVM